MFRQLFNIFLLKPYGNNLLAPSAQIWIFFVRLFILGMATTEALSWGYVGRFLLPNSWGVSVFIGAIIFFFVWGMDASLMMLDRNERKPRQSSSAVQQRSIASADRSDADGDDATGRNELQANAEESKPTWQSQTKMVGGATTRLVLVVASLVITAPFVALIVFEKDIDAKITEDLSQKIETQTKEIRTRLETEIALRNDRLKKLEEESNALFDLIKQRENELNDEMRNKDRPGYGTISKKFELQVAQARAQFNIKQNEVNEYKKSIAQKSPAEKELSDFVSAVERKDYALLSRLWSINANPNSFSVRNAIITKDFESTPEYKKAEFAIQAFLLFIFFGLVVMKIYEPRAIRVYYNAALQSDWIRYLAGAYDKHFHNTHEVSTASPNSMTPFYFEEFIGEILPKLLARTKAEMDAARKRENLERAKKELSILLGENTGHFDALSALQEGLGKERAELITCESELKAKIEARNLILNEILDLARREQALKGMLSADSPEAQVEAVTRMLQVVLDRRHILDAQKSKLSLEESTLARQRELIIAKQAAISGRIEALTKQLEHIANLEMELSRLTADGILDRMRGAKPKDGGPDPSAV